MTAGRDNRRDEQSIDTGKASEEDSLQDTIDELEGKKVKDALNEENDGVSRRNLMKILGGGVLGAGMMNSLSSPVEGKQEVDPESNPEIGSSQTLSDMAVGPISTPKITSERFRHTPQTTAKNVKNRDLVSTDHIVLHVDPDAGSDSNSGTSSSPLASLQEALHRLPIILQHNVTIYLEDGVYNNEPGATASGIHYLNHIKGAAGTKQIFHVKGNPSSPSNVVLDSITWLNLSIRGQVPYRTMFEGITFNCKVQNKGGVIEFRNSNMYGSTTPSMKSSIDGYAGQTMLRNCDFGSNMDYAVFANMGHRVYVKGCSGSVNNAAYKTRHGGAVWEGGGTNISAPKNHEKHGVWYQ